MDNLHLEEVQAFRKLREYYEDQLRLVGFEMCDLPDDISGLLDECVDLQRATNLPDLQENYLKVFYAAKQKERIDHNLTLAKLRAEIKEQEDELAKEAAECATLEKFTTAVNQRLISEAEMQRNKIMLEGKMQGLQDRLSALTIPEDLNIDELIKKVDLLKHNKQKDK